MTEFLDYFMVAGALGVLWDLGRRLAHKPAPPPYDDKELREAIAEQARIAAEAYAKASSAEASASLEGDRGTDHDERLRKVEDRVSRLFLQAVPANKAKRA